MTVIPFAPPATQERNDQLEDCMGEMGSLIGLMQVVVSGEHLVEHRDYLVSRMELVHMALDKLLFPR